MNNNSETHFTTGDFADICNVSKHTLFHYDDIGIFSPEIKDENGYRYYSISQLEVFDVISILKELDMPLKEIKAYLDKRSPQKLIELLERQEALIRNKIIYLKKIARLVQHKKNVTKKACEIDTDSISIMSMPTEYLIRTKATEGNLKSIALCVSKHIQFCEKHDIYSPNAIGGMLSMEDVQNRLDSKYSYFYSLVKTEPKNIPAFKKISGNYITAYHKGSYFTSGNTYGKVIDYALHNNLALSDFFYEDVLLDDLSVKGYDNYVLKISIMVKD